jgi:hypothetical protein
MQMSNRRYVDPGEIASDYAAIGDTDAAFLWWNKACDGTAESLGFIRVNRDMDRYRSDPRYAVLLKRVGLPQ